MAALPKNWSHLLQLILHIAGFVIVLYCLEWWLVLNIHLVLSGGLGESCNFLSLQHFSCHAATILPVHQKN